MSQRKRSKGLGCSQVTDGEEDFSPSQTERLSQDQLNQKVDCDDPLSSRSWSPISASFCYQPSLGLPCSFPHRRVSWFSSCL